MKRSVLGAFSFLLAAFVLAGCSDGHMSDVRAWMQAERSKARPAVQPLPEPKPYVAVDYTAPAGAEPNWFMGQEAQSSHCLSGLLALGASCLGSGWMAKHAGGVISSLLYAPS